MPGAVSTRMAGWLGAAALLQPVVYQCVHTEIAPDSYMERFCSYVGYTPMRLVSHARGEGEVGTALSVVPSQKGKPQMRRAQ